MGTYHVIQDFFGKSQDDQLVDPDAVSVSAYWILAVVQFKYPLTYRRAVRGSFSKTFTDAVETRGMLIITGDCQSMSVSSSKSSHVTNLNATLMPGEANYLNEIMPGDYCFAWMMNDETTYLKVIDKLKNGGSCNDFMDGLKFMGQVQTIRKKLTVSPEGVKSVRYPLTAAGFTQLDTQLYYEPHLAERLPAIGQIFARYGADLNKLILKKGRGIDVNTAIPIFLDILLGTGAQQNLGRGNTDERLKATAGLEAPYAFIVPKMVGTILGQQNQSKPGGAFAYSDLLQVIIGVQKYSDLEQGYYSGVKDPQIFFMPDHTHGNFGGNRKNTTVPMMGTFIPDTPQFTNHPVWSILNQYLNPAVNEMFTTLRVDANNKVVPTLIVRQLPFTSSLYGGQLDVTRYLELPRWGIHPVLIRGEVDLGRSDALRFNFVHVYAQLTNSNKPTATEQVVLYPPERDDLDVSRSGLRGFFQTIPCSVEDAIRGGPRKWMELLADILMGQQLSMTGNLTTVGIQAPICVGDNIEYDGVVLHMEGISHTAGIAANGQKSFTTTIQCTHGLRAKPSTEDLGLFPGTRHEDLSTFDPGSTYESTNPPNSFSTIGSGTTAAVQAEQNGPVSLNPDITIE